MVKTFPAIVIVVFLVDLVGLGDTVYRTVPFPTPLLPEVIVTQAALLAAVQLQLAQVETAMVPDPSAEENDLLVGEIE